MRLLFRLVGTEESNMSGQKKIKITFKGDSVSMDGSGPSEQLILGCSFKPIPPKEVVLGTRHSRSPVEDAADWREKVNNVQERNLMALKNSILTDITLEVGPEHTIFQAHKLILSLGSPVFEAMFYGPLAEQGEKISIPDIMPDGFKVLLRHLYGDVMVLKDEIEALNTWIAADKYCVPKLKEECDKYFCNCPMSSSNIWKLLESAVFLNSTALVSRCKQYLESHTESSLLAEGFLETKTETVKHILSMPTANVSELVLLKSVIHWGRQKVNNGQAVSLIEVLKPLLPCVRFGALTPSEFCKFLDETDDLLENFDALAILKHLTKPLAYALPEWCCKTNWQRERGASSSRMERINQILAARQKRKEKYIKLKKQHTWHHSRS